ncbi:hypothetical protein [Gemmatimonas sp.]|uniref:hypothetical protein n=1 Tax=Gemmatimonas sp. TaxID=1962908 RepID=UPI00333E2E49
MTATEAVRPAPSVEIVGEYQILAQAVLHVLPHAQKAEKNAAPSKLQHLVIEPDGTLAATNGRTIAAHRWAVTPAPGVRVLIELPDIDSNTMLKRLARKAIKEEPLFGITMAPSGQTLVLRVGRESLTITPAWHSDEYPNWRSLFAGFKASESRKHPAAQIGIDTDYLKLFDHACQFTLGGASDAVIVRKMGEPNFWGAVMPFRVEVYDDTFPSWCASDDFTPAPIDDPERIDPAIITEPYTTPEGMTSTVSVNGGPEIDFSETAAVTDALRPVVARAMGVAE